MGRIGNPGLEMQESRFGNAGCKSGCDLIVCLSGRVAWDEANRVKFDITRVLIRLHNQGPGKLLHSGNQGKINLTSQNEPRIGDGEERGF